MIEKQMTVGNQVLGLGNRVKAQVIENGRVVSETDWTPNLILDQGMDRLPTTLICDLFLYCAIGTGNTPTEDDSGAVTATTSGTTCTASGSIFAPGDVGKLLRFDTGEKAMITAYTSATVVTLGATLGVTTQLFTMYRVSQSGLATEVKRSNTYLTGSGGTETTRSGSTYTHRRTFDFTAETGSVNYAEVGFSHSATVASNLNSRALFAGGAVTVLNGQQLRVIYDFQVTVSPTSVTDVETTITGWPSLSYSVTADAGTDKITLASHGFAANQKVVLSGSVAPGGLSFGTTYFVITDTSNTFGLALTSGGGAIDITSTGTSVTLVTSQEAQQSLTKHSISKVDTSTGATVAQETSPGNHLCNEPLATGCGMVIGSATTALAAWPDAADVAITAVTGGAKSSLTASSYTNGTFYIERYAVYATSEANSAVIRSINLTRGNSATRSGLTVLYKTPQEKLNTHTLTITWRWTWDRVFS